MIYFTIEHAPAHFILQKSRPMCLPTGTWTFETNISLSAETLSESHYAVFDLDRFQFLHFSASKEECETYKKGVLEGDDTRDLQVVKVMFIWG